MPKWQDFYCTKVHMGTVYKYAWIQAIRYSEIICFGHFALWFSSSSSISSTIKMHKVSEQVHWLPESFTICFSTTEKPKHTYKVEDFQIRNLNLLKSPLSCFYKQSDTRRTVCFILPKKVGMCKAIYHIISFSQYPTTSGNKVS